uniref:Myb-like DNA-binding domain containing protein n=1 Tax=Mucochytrium quahogii TaxID=96639 RepID=A0A7S2RVP9_9STRA|mmetsp:Transcript_31639/g.50517  ORF Transcript_31639/g.50517 Transcript_31639/m.50517 type:complete len:199 (-) Transcript_31639:966-1562(-)
MFFPTIFKTKHKPERLHHKRTFISTMSVCVLPAGIGLDTMKPVKREREEVDTNSNNIFESYHSSYKRRRHWEKQEDKSLVEAVEKCKNATNGKVQWKFVATLVEGRTAKQCRDRMNCISVGSKDLKRAWTTQEDKQLMDLHDQYGNAWVTIAKHFQNRNDNMVKSRFRLLSEQTKSPDQLLLYDLMLWSSIVCRDKNW